MGGGGGKGEGEAVEGVEPRRRAKVTGLKVNYPTDSKTTNVGTSTVH